MGAGIFNLSCLLVVLLATLGYLLSRKGDLNMKDKVKASKSKGFQKLEAGNEVLKGKGFFISYRAGSTTPALCSALADMATMLGGPSSLREKDDETALVIGNRFRILKGGFQAGLPRTPHTGEGGV